MTRDDGVHGRDLSPEERRVGDRVFGTRLGGVAVFVAVFMAFSLVSRVALTVKAAAIVSWNPTLAAAYAIGAAFDLLTALLCALPLTVWLVVLPQKAFGSRLHRRAVMVSVWLGLFAAAFVTAAEWVFWDELGVRFNFVAVDYLIYTYEVVGNIWQSYPMPAILAGLALAATGAFWLLRRTAWLDRWLASTGGFGRRLVTGSLLVAVPLGAIAVVSQSDIPQLDNNNNRELAKNGVFSFFAAWRAKELDYGAFYRRMDDRKALVRARRLTGSPPEAFRSKNPWDFVHRVENPGPERHLNVIQVTVESLSTFFMGAFGSELGLTPNMDRIAGDGLLFVRCFATGTRTTRGMEAIVLSIPPTPGRSILHRSNNEGLFNLGTVFRDRGYETVFFYGGYGYFDNMNHFFGSNGFRIVDRNAVAAEDVSFATAWGACDEDVYRWTVREADSLHAADTPFYFFVMTTSNHRPYTYPAGRIDIPSGSGREGAVKYSDFAVGELFRAARTKPWFDDTVFIVVADHTASSAGKPELEVSRYRIPQIIYSPKLVEAKVVTTQCSQIDLAPTLLALLGISYDSLFFGRDVLAMRQAEGRAYVANYLKLGQLKQREVAVLRPDGNAAFYGCDLWGENLVRAEAGAPGLLERTTAAYQAAYLLFSHGLLGEEVVRDAGAVRRAVRSELEAIKK